MSRDAYSAYIMQMRVAIKNNGERISKTELRKLRKPCICTRTFIFNSNWKLENQVVLPFEINIFGSLSTSSSSATRHVRFSLSVLIMNIICTVIFSNHICACVPSFDRFMARFFSVVRCCFHFFVCSTLELVKFNLACLTLAYATHHSGATHWKVTSYANVVSNSILILTVGLFSW